MRKITISVVIVNWNGAAWLSDCLSSLEKQSFSDFEVVLVDNASTDNSLDLVAKKFSWVSVIKSKQNLGFAGGNNLALPHCRGQYFVLLNNDTVVDHDYLQSFLKIFEQNPAVGIAQSKIVRQSEPELLDTCGSWWTYSTFLYNFGHGKKSSLRIYNTPRRMFSGKGASLMIRREVIEQVGLFDPAFWCYYEEIDFCHRAQSAGWQVWYWPEALCYHAGSQTSSIFTNGTVHYHDLKNRFRSYLKNFSGVNLFWVLPTALLLNGLQAFSWLLRGKFDLHRSYWKAIGWNIINLPETLKLRGGIAKLRKVGDSEFLPMVTRHPKPSYYFHLLLTGLENYQDKL